MGVDKTRGFMSNDWLLLPWAVLALGSCTTLIHDLRRNNAHLGSARKAVVKTGFAAAGSRLPTGTGPRAIDV